MHHGIRMARSAKLRYVKLPRRRPCERVLPPHDCGSCMTPAGPRWPQHFNCATVNDPPQRGVPCRPGRGDVWTPRYTSEAAVTSDWAFEHPLSNPREICAKSIRKFWVHHICTRSRVSGMSIPYLLHLIGITICRKVDQNLLNFFAGFLLPHACCMHSGNQTLLIHFATRGIIFLNIAEDVR